MIALDDDGTRNLTIPPSLKLGPNVNQDGAAPNRIGNLLWLEPHQPSASPGQEAVQITHCVHHISDPYAESLRAAGYNPH